ncbi:histidine kinase [Erysipelotrichaceae bacterium HCN-30851]
MNKFQRKLQRQIAFYIFVVLILSIIIFTLSLIYYANEENHRKLNKAEKDLSTFIYGVRNTYENTLYNMSETTNVKTYIQGDDSDRHKLQTKLYQMYYSLQNKAEVQSQLLLSDTKNNILFHTFPMIGVSKQFQAFHETINQKAIEKDDIVEGTITLSTGKNYYALTKRVYDQDNFIGYISLYLDEDDFSYQLFSQQYQGIVYDEFKNVIAVSDQNFVNSYLNRCITDYLKPSFELGNQQYVTQTMKLNNIYITAIVPSRTQGEFLFLGIILILFVGGILMLGSIKYARRLSKRMSYSVALLCEEMEEIKKGNLDHVIQINTDDEIETISEHINEMVTQIQKLSERNTELKYVSQLSELKQLEAQFNPHFLYNTLETIRYSILMQDGIASDMIIKFTKILRYSINNSYDNVKLGNDLEYIQIFLQIQKYRFKDRLTYTIDVDEDCLNMMVPKLILQPLLENSIKSGFKHKTTLQIHVKGFLLDNMMILTVEDDGIGIQKEELNDICEQLNSNRNNSNHHGLFNTNRRLQLMYGEKSGISIESEYKQKTKVTIRIITGGMYV